MTRSTQGRFYQRSIRRFRTYTSPADGREYIEGAHLSCGHYQPYKRRKLATSKRTAMPCSACGYMNRTAWERQRVAANRARAVEAAAADPIRLVELVALVEAAAQLLSASPGTRRAWDLRSEMARRIRAAGLRDSDTSPGNRSGRPAMDRDLRDRLLEI